MRAARLRSFVVCRPVSPLQPRARPSRCSSRQRRCWAECSPTPRMANNSPHFARTAVPRRLRLTAMALAAKASAPRPPAPAAITPTPAGTVRPAISPAPDIRQAGGCSAATTSVLVDFGFAFECAPQALIELHETSLENAAFVDNVAKELGPRDRVWPFSGEYLEAGEHSKCFDVLAGDLPMPSRIGRPKGWKMLQRPAKHCTSFFDGIVPFENIVGLDCCGRRV